MGMLLLADRTMKDNATFHLWRRECATRKFLQDINIQCFCEVMGVLLLADVKIMDDATFHLWRRECATRKFLQDINIQCFCEVMGVLLLADVTIMDDATFHLWRRECATPKFLQDGVIQCFFCKVMGVLLLAEGKMKHNATFHLWRKECATPKFLQDMLISVLLRSDGSAVACGRTNETQCDIPPVAAVGCCYVFDVCQDYVLQVGVAFQDDTAVLTCWDLAGHELLHLRAIESDLACDIYKRIAHDLQVSLQSLRLVLSGGQLLASICRATPLATIADLGRPGQVNLSEPGDPAQI